MWCRAAVLSYIRFRSLKLPPNTLQMRRIQRGDVWDVPLGPDDYGDFFSRLRPGTSGERPPYRGWRARNSATASATCFGPWVSMEWSTPGITTTSVCGTSDW